MNLGNMIGNMMEKLASCRRVLQVARKPSSDEFQKIAKICAIGILFVGMVGFVMYSLSILFIG